MATNAWIELPLDGVTSINADVGAVTIAAGSGILVNTAGNVITISNTEAGGTVTSVGLALPSIFTVSGSPVTTTGTLTATLNTQTANLIFAGPASGSAAAPTFRSLVSLDIPNNAANTSGTAANITATSNATLVTLSSLSLPLSQTTGVLPLTQVARPIRYTSSAVSSNSSALSSGTFATFSNSPTLTFTPVVTGEYKVYCIAPINSSLGANYAKIRVFNSAGSATLLTENDGITGGNSGTANFFDSSYTQSTYTLTAGNPYSFVLQGLVSSGSITCVGADSTFYIYAE